MSSVLPKASFTEIPITDPFYGKVTKICETKGWRERKKIKQEIKTKMTLIMKLLDTLPPWLSVSLFLENSKIVCP